MIGFFCITQFLHFSKRFNVANIHFSTEIDLSIPHFFYLSVSTFSAAALFQQYSNNLFRRQPVLQQLYFIPVLIYTPNKVKSKQREEKRCFAKTEHPICRNLPMIQLVFLLAVKIFVTASCFQLTSVGENPAYFRTFATDRKQVDFGREKEVFQLVLIQVKSAQNGRFQPEKQAEKGFSTV